MLTILGRATAWTVLHNLLRSHLELSLTIDTEILTKCFHCMSTGKFISNNTETHFNNSALCSLEWDCVDNGVVPLLPHHHQLIFVGVMQRHVSHLSTGHDHIGAGFFDGLHLGLHQILLSLAEVHELIRIVNQHCTLWDRHGWITHTVVWSSKFKTWGGETGGSCADYLCLGHRAVKGARVDGDPGIFNWCHISFCLLLKHHAMQHRGRQHSTALQTSHHRPLLWLVTEGKLIFS